MSENTKLDITETETRSTSSYGLTSEIYLFKALESRSLELNALNTECKTKAPKLSTQRLPTFMRRRASSHNPKRVPKSVRQSVVRQLNKTQKDSNVKNKNKNKKKYINKTKMELNIERRNNRKDRTVLHVWFAKRFKMEFCWNRLMAVKNCTKNQRVLYHNSKNDCVFYYLSFYNCIEMDYTLSNREQLINYLSNFTHSDIGFGFGAKIFQMGNREGVCILYDFKSYPFKAIASCNFLWNQNSSKLWLWVHISVCDQVFQLFNSLTQNHFKIIRQNLERFRLIGPKAYQLVLNCLKLDLSHNLNCEQMSNEWVQYLRCNGKSAFFINCGESLLFKDQLIDSKKCSAECDLVVITKNNVFNKRYATDLIVSSESAKHIWHTLTQNRSHKVGAMRDFEMIALNTSSLLFPKIGFIDIMSNTERMKILANILKTDKPLYVIRNEAIISCLAKNINSLSNNSILNTIENKNEALINVELNCCNRGVPQELDHICIPNANEIENLQKSWIANDNTIVENMSSEMDQNSNDRIVIGLVEFGSYSMETSRGKAIGVITLNGLKELIKINQSVRINQIYKNNNIFASVKLEKSTKYRFVTLKAIGSTFSA